MDFEGQRRAEQHLLHALLLFGLVGFVGGYATSSFRLMVYVCAAGLVFSLLLVVPDWSWYNRHPVHWLPPSSAPGGSSSVLSGSGSGGSAAGVRAPAEKTTTTTTAKNKAA
jgi:signal peptidase complex subunit 1